MKKVGAFIALLSIAVSCNIKDVNPPTFCGPILYGYTESDQTTKTGIDVDAEGVGTIYWNAHEEISVFFGSTNARYRSTNTQKETTVVFEPASLIGGTESATSEKWGLYPYDAEATSDGSYVTTTIPADQQCVSNTFGNNIFPMIAHTSSNELHFKNVCGGIKFSLASNEIQRIYFKGNNNEDIAGKVSLVLDESGLPTASVIEGEKIITLTPQEGSTFASGTNYYLIMLPTVLSNGFSMAFETESRIGIFDYTAGSVTIKRSIFAKKANIDLYVTYHVKEESDITSWEKRIKDANLY